MVILLLIALGVVGIGVDLLIDAMKHREYRKERSFFLSGISVIPVFITNVLLLITIPWDRDTLNSAIILLLCQTAIVFLYNTTIIIYAGLENRSVYWFLYPGVVYGVIIYPGILSMRVSGLGAFIISTDWLRIYTLTSITILYVIIAVIYNMYMFKQRNNK